MKQVYPVLYHKFGETMVVLSSIIISPHVAPGLIFTRPGGMQYSIDLSRFYSSLKGVDSDLAEILTFGS